MLVSAVIRLRAAQAGGRLHDLGRAAQGWFLGEVRAADPVLAKALHQGSELRPYTVALCAGPRQAHAPWLRVTALTDEVAGVLLEHVLPAVPEGLTLAGQPFQVVGATLDGADHPWAGQTTHEELAQTYLLGTSEPPPWLNLEFATPTTFRSGGKHVPFPLPALVFDHWLNKWNHFAPLSLNPDLKSFAEEHLSVSRYRLASQVVRFGSATFIGFVGRCSFRALRDDTYWLRLLHMLTAYAFYCGTGHKTTVGLGQTRVRSGEV